MAGKNSILIRGLKVLVQADNRRADIEALAESLAEPEANIRRAMAHACRMKLCTCDGGAWTITEHGIDAAARGTTARRRHQGTTGAAPRAELQTAIIDLVEQNPHGLAIEEIAETLGKDITQINPSIGHAVRNGRVRRIGAYYHPPFDKPKDHEPSEDTTDSRAPSAKPTTRCCAWCSQPLAGAGPGAPATAGIGEHVRVDDSLVGPLCSTCARKAKGDTHGIITTQPLPPAYENRRLAVTVTMGTHGGPVDIEIDRPQHLSTAEASILARMLLAAAGGA